VSDESATDLWQLHLLHEACAQVLQNNAIRGSEESQNVQNEVLLVCSELLPVANVITEINLLSCSTQDSKAPDVRNRACTLTCDYPSMISLVSACAELTCSYVLQLRLSRPHLSRSWPQPSCTSPRWPAESMSKP
jgi:hypothetical protein